MDWVRLGYKGTAEIKGSPQNGRIVRALGQGQPVEAFIQYENTNYGHYFLIVGTSRERLYGDIIFTIADPLRNHTMDMSWSDLNNWGHWRYSWIIAD
jgi:hypothetical protein